MSQTYSCLVAVTAEVTSTTSDGVVVLRVGEENVPGLPVALVAVVEGADGSAPAVTLLPDGTSCAGGGLAVRGNCVGANDEVSDRDAVGKGVMLMVSASDARLSGSVGGRAVGTLPLLPDVKSSVGLTVAPISSSEPRAVESRDEDTFKTGVAGKVVKEEIRFVSLSKMVLVTDWVSEVGSTRVETTE